MQGVRRQRTRECYQLRGVLVTCAPSGASRRHGARVAKEPGARDERSCRSVRIAIRFCIFLGWLLFFCFASVVCFLSGLKMSEFFLLIMLIFLLLVSVKSVHVLSLLFMSCHFDSCPFMSSCFYLFFFMCNRPLFMSIHVLSFPIVISFHFCSCPVYSCHFSSLPVISHHVYSNLSFHFLFISCHFSQFVEIFLISTLLFSCHFIFYSCLVISKYF